MKSRSHFLTIFFFVLLFAIPAAGLGFVAEAFDFSLSLSLSGVLPTVVELDTNVTLAQLAWVLAILISLLSARKQFVYDVSLGRRSSV